MEGPLVDGRLTIQHNPSRGVAVPVAETDLEAISGADVVAGL
jgi:hypothetical protein